MDDSSDEELFYFESPVRYDPREKAPILIPQTPQIDKYFHQNAGKPLRFQLEPLRPISSTPQPKRFKQKNAQHEENSETNSQICQVHPIQSFTPRKGGSLSNDNTPLSKPPKQSNSIIESNYAFSPTVKKNLKKFKTIRTDGTNLIQVLDIVREEFDKAQETNFQGDLVFSLKGIAKQTLLDIMKKAISQIVIEFGYFPSSFTNSSSIYCEKKNVENIDNTPSSSKPSKPSNLNNIGQQPNKTFITISAISDENAQTVIKGQLLSGFKGIVVFTPVRGRFNSALMSQYPQKVIDICKLHGFSAKLVDPNLQAVECDMRTKVAQKPPPIPKKPQSSNNTNDQIAPKKLEKQMNSNAQQSNQKPRLPSPSANITNAPHFSEAAKSSSTIEFNNPKLAKSSANDDQSQQIQDEQILKVEVPWNSEKDAEALIRKTLSGNFVGLLRFMPSIGLYSVISMKNYPDRIIEICEEFNFKAIHKCGQIIECQKTGEKPKVDIKKVAIPPHSKKGLEQVVRAQLESGFIGNVQFLSVGNHAERIQEICEEFKFESKVVGNVVNVKMTERKSKELIVNLPLESSKALKHKLQKYLECGYIGPIIFKPQRCEPNRPVIPQFANIVCDICRIYSCPAKILDSSGAILAQLSPKLVEINTNSEELIEQQVRLHLSDFKTGFMIFSIKLDLPDVKKKADLILNICKSEQFPAKFADFYAGRVICNSNKNGTKKAEVKNIDIKTESTITSNKNVITISLPIYDPKAAEQIIRKQLSSKFIGSVLFVPKNSLYSKSAMPEYPQKIVNICSDCGFNASIVNERCQIVECKMKQI